MTKVLHLLGSSADEQTRQIHQMLVDGLGPEFSCLTRVVGPGGDLRNLPAAVLKLRHQPADLTHAWGIQALVGVVLAGHSRVLFSPDQFAGPRSLRWIRSLMDRGNVTFISPTFTQQRLAIAHGIDPQRCKVVQPGVDFGRIRRRDPQLRAALGLCDTDFVLIAPGESSRQTAHDQAVWACGILHVIDPSYKLLIWGRGPRAKQVAELAERLHQPNLVKVAEMPGREPMRFEDVLPAADVCLVTAGGAAPTLPIATAMAAGVPIVSTVTYMLAELLEDRHTALMVPRRSPRALVQRVLDLREDPALRAKLIDTARAEAYEHFSMTRMLDEYRRIYAVREQIHHGDTEETEKTMKLPV
jgi:glycosyltransferase involved in cell wall biosynthesis